MFQDDIRQLQELARTQPWRPREDTFATAGEVFTAGFDQLVSEEQSISAQRWRVPQVELRERQVLEAFGDSPATEHVRALMGSYFEYHPSVFRKLRQLIDDGEIVIGEGAMTSTGLPDFERGREARLVEAGRGRGGAVGQFGFSIRHLPESPWQISYESSRAEGYASRYWPALQAMLTVEAAKGVDPRVMTDSEIDQKIQDMTAILRESNQDVINRREGASGNLAMFGGAALGAVTDPLILPAMFVGAGAIRGPSLVRNAAKAFGLEAGIATAIEVPVQSMVYGFKQEIESPWTKGDAAFNVLAAAVGAGAIRGTASAGIDAASMLRAGAPLRTVEAERIITEHLQGPLNTRQAEDMLARYRSMVERGSVRPSEETDLAARELQEWLDIAGEARLGDTMADLEEHFARVELARDDLSEGRPTRVVPDDERIPVPGGREATNDNLVVIDPDGLEVDAQRFQFKALTDERGVSDRLRGVERFDQRLAGVALVYEQLDGRRFIVDGHQRLALAQRARAAGQDPSETRLSVFVLREADGVTDGEARAIAAIKNIAEGTGSATDAAKVLREMGALGEGVMPAGMPPLPPNSSLVRQARGLARLSDDAFGMVINRMIREDYAAIVGQRITDPAQQAAVIRLLARTDPANQNQAAHIVEQARVAGFEVRRAEDLFGEADIADSMYLERAKVLDAAMKALRRDRDTFRTVVARETELRETGNVLDQEANQARLETDSALVTALAREANRVGPISDALTSAAQRVRDGARPADVAGDFLGALRAQGLRADSPGPRVGAAGPEPEIGLITRAGEMTRPEARAAKNNMMASQAGRNLDQIFEGAEELQRVIVELGEELAGLDGVRFKNPGLKARATAEEKLPRKGITADQLNDIARAGFAIDAPELGDVIVRRLATRLEVLDEGLQVTPLGYSDRKLMVRDANGTVGEIQLWSPRLFDAKVTGGGTELHVAARALQRDGKVIPGREAEFEELQRQSRKLYGDAVADESDAWIRATLAGMEADEADALLQASPKLRNRSANVSSDATGSFSSSMGDRGVQPAPGERITQPPMEPSGASTMTPGRSSDLTLASTFPGGRAIDSPPDISIQRQHTQVTTDLFGPVPARQQQLADAQRSVNERLGAGREDVPVESAGDLFDPGRARQTDLADQQMAQIAREQGLDMPQRLNADEQAELERLLREEGQFLEMPDRVELDPATNEAVLQTRGMRETFEEIRRQERALRAVEACTLGRR